MTHSEFDAMWNTLMATVALLDFMLMTISLNLANHINKTLKNFGKLGNCKVGTVESYSCRLFPSLISTHIQVPHNTDDTDDVYPLICIWEFLLHNWVLISVSTSSSHLYEAASETFLCMFIFSYPIYKLDFNKKTGRWYGSIILILHIILLLLTIPIRLTISIF